MKLQTVMLKSGKSEFHLLLKISALQPLLLKHSLKTSPHTVIQLFPSLVVHWLFSSQLDVSYGNVFRRKTPSTFQVATVRELASFLGIKRKQLTPLYFDFYSIKCATYFIIHKTRVFAIDTVRSCVVSRMLV